MKFELFRPIKHLNEGFTPKWQPFKEEELAACGKIDWSVFFCE